MKNLHKPTLAILLALLVASSGFADVSEGSNPVGVTLPGAARTGTVGTGGSVEEGTASNQHWTTISGGASPAGSGTPYSYAGGGCLELHNTSSWYAGLNLRDGDVITFLRLFFMDTDPAANVTGRLRHADGVSMGGTTTLASVSSSGAPGFNSVGVALDHTVDNTTGSLLFEAFGTGSDLRLCAFRITVERGNAPPLEYWSGAVAAAKSTYESLSFGPISAGCKLRNFGGGINGDFDLEVQLPEGALITEMRFFWYDEDPNFTEATLYTADGQGVLSFLGSVASNGSGFGNATVGVAHTVSNSEEHLAIRFDLNEFQEFPSDLRACRVLLTYIPPELIFADGFESGDTGGWDATVE